MRTRWMAFLSIGVLSGIVLLLFALQLRPVYIPQGQASDGNQPLLTQPTVTFVDPSIGPADAKVTIVEYGDFQCGPCADMTSSAEAVQAAFPKDVRLVWKHLPNDTLHPAATPAAVAAQCAERQNKFWPYAQAVFARQDSLTADQLPEIAQEVGLDMGAFQSCLNAQDTLPIVQKDEQEGQALRIAATPTVFVNDQRYVGSVSAQELTGYVQQILQASK